MVMDDGSSSSGVDNARCAHHHASTSKRISVQTLDSNRSRHAPRLMQIARPCVAGGVTMTSLPKGYLARHGETAWVDHPAHRPDSSPALCARRGDGCRCPVVPL